MTLEQFLSEYSGSVLGAFGIGLSVGLLFTYFKKYFEKI